MSINSEKGFTLLELMAATAVMGLILPLVITFTFQVIRGTARIQQDLVIQQDLDNASTWFTRDLSQAQTIDLDNGETKPSLRIDWVDETGWGSDSGSPAHYVEYTLDAPNLLRDYDGTVSIVGRNVAAIEFSRTCPSICEVVSVKITSAYSGATATLDYNITPRTDAPLEYVAP